MAKVTVSSSGKKAKPVVKSRMKEELSTTEIKLPTEYKLPGGSFDSFSYLIHGIKKIGKTKLSLQVFDDTEEKVLLLQHDPEQQAYKRLEIVLKSWRMFLNALKKLEALAEEGEFPYTRIVVDRADVWYRNCQNFVCEKLAISHPTEEGYGKGWDAVRNEFNNGVQRLLALPCGKFFLCHSIYKEIETIDGEKIDKLVPNLTKTAEECLNGPVDGWFAYDYEGKERVLYLQGSDNIGAGHRIDGHFLTREGKRIRTLYMGRSAEEAFKNLMNAFNNRIDAVRYVPKG